MSINVNLVNGVLVDSSTNAPIDTLSSPETETTPEKGYGIHSNGYADTQVPFAASRMIGKSLTASSATDSLTDSLDRLYELCHSIEDDEVALSFSDDIDELYVKVEDETSSNAALIYNNGDTTTTHPVELSEAALAYINSNPAARKVLEVNISTGIHAGNRPDTVAVEEVSESNKVFEDEINSLHNLIVEQLVSEGFYDSDYDDDYDDDYLEDDDYDDDYFNGYYDSYYFGDVDHERDNFDDEEEDVEENVEEEDDVITPFDVWDASREDSVNSSYFYSRPSVDEVPGAGSGTLTDSPKEEEEEEDNSNGKSGDYDEFNDYDLMAEILNRIFKVVDNL